ncbi:MAG: tRNA (guanosine(37)-N1)-methyltransferase TrmD, partial [Acidimicrobiia bacterium]|nr:tRNA (guanosine(37)-N1)-methyltransferase TrmD [Acidimicrobiia bacterium]
GRSAGGVLRVRFPLVDDQPSVGACVSPAREVAAMVLIEAVGRLLPGVLGNEFSTDEESFSDNLLEYPHYTRPSEFRGWVVPEVLLSGHHEQVQRWRKAQSLARTLALRPDLIAARGGLTETEGELLGEFGLGVSEQI